MQFKKTITLRLTAGLLLVSTLVSPSFALTGTVSSGGDSLRVRSDANTDSAVLTALNDGTKVEVLSATENGWYQISYGSFTGFVCGDYLLVDEAQAEAAAEIKYGRVHADALNVRSGAGIDYDRVDSLRGGQVVEILGESDGWYQIESGYVSADYIVIVDPSEAVSSGKGQEIANYALTFVGYPYVYGGSSPSGFDCSGFAQYVYKQFGYSINRTASAQLDNGVAVSMSELQPGDLVMFKKGSSSKRASHVGIYIGNGQFVHASTTNVGVIVSSLSQSYYTTGFVGGRRIV